MNRTTTRSLLTVASAVAALTFVSGCELPEGPAGSVAKREMRFSSATKANKFWLTVTTKEGQRKEFEVYPDDYNHCPAGAAYPACAKGTKKARA